MGWFSEGRDSTPTSTEASVLWDQEAPPQRPGAGVMELTSGFIMPRVGTVFYGWVRSGTLKKGDFVLVRGRAGFARGQIQRITLNNDEKDSVEEGRYVSVVIPKLSVRVEVLDLDKGSTITAV